MHPVMMETISTQRGIQAREQAAAWRRAREARADTARAQRVGIRFVPIARTARALAGRKRLHRQAAA